MDVIDWLKVVLRDARFVKGTDDALQALPDMGADGPVMTTVSLADGDWYGFPVAFHRELSEALIPALQQGLRGREDVSKLTADDPLVRLLTELLLEANALSPRSLSLVMLEMARQCSQGLGGQDKDLLKLDPAAARRLADASKKLPDDPSLRGDALVNVVWSLNARLALAWKHAGKLDPTLKPTRIYQALVASKLAWVLPAGKLRLPDDLPLVASVLGSKSRPDLLKQAFNAVKLTIEAAFKDPASGRGLIDLANGSTDSTALAINPTVIAAAFATLPGLVDAKALTDAGLPKELAKGLTNGKGTGPLVATLQPIAKAIRTWDMLAAAAARCAPVSRHGDTWSTRQGPIKAGQPWALLAPSAGKPRTAWVVGVASDDLMVAAHAKASERGPVVFSALRAVWAHLAAEAETLGGVASPTNGPWYSAFGDEASAQKFEQSVKSRLRAPVQLDLGDLGGTLALPHHAVVETRRVHGGVQGGWDGARLALGGAAVVQSLGTAAPPLGGLDDVEDSAGGANLLSEMDSSHDAPIDDTPLLDPFADDGTAYPAPDTSDGGDIDPFADTPPTSPSSTTPSDPFASDGVDPFGAAAPPAGSADGFGFDEPDPFAAPQSEAASPRIAAPMLLDDHLVVEDIPYAPDAATPSTSARPQGASSADREPPVHAFDDDPLISRPPLPSTNLDPLMSEPALLGGQHLLGDPEPALSIAEDPVSHKTFPPNDPLAHDPGPPEDPDEGPDPGFEDDEPRALDNAPPGLVARESSSRSDSVNDAMNMTVDIEDDEDEDSEAEQFFLPPPDAARAAAESAELDDPFGLNPSSGGPPATENMTELDAPQDTPDFGFSVEHDDTTSQDASSPDSDEAASLRTLGISETDLGDLLEGYVMLGDGAEIVFGRRYGSTLVDVHRYPDASPPPYRAFIQDKIRERFVPQNDRTAPVPSGVTPEALDVRAVAAALGPG